MIKPKSVGYLIGTDHDHIPVIERHVVKRIMRNGMILTSAISLTPSDQFYLHIEDAKAALTAALTKKAHELEVLLHTVNTDLIELRDHQRARAYDCTPEITTLKL